MAKKEIKEDKKGIAESFLEGIPFFGNLFKELGKTEVFKKRFGEVDEKIEENLRKGVKKTWSFESRVAIRPIFEDIKKESSEIVVKKDYLYGKKADKLTLAVKVPSEKVEIDLISDDLVLKTEKWEKTINLPEKYTLVKKKKYKKGVLVLELTK